MNDAGDVRRRSYDARVASPRTVNLVLEFGVEGGVSCDPPRDLPSLLALEAVTKAFPSAAHTIHGLHEAGWVIQDVSTQQIGASRRRCAQVKLRKDFVRASPLSVSDDARASGVTDDLSPVFVWAADQGNDDDGCWDDYDGEL